MMNVMTSLIAHSTLIVIPYLYLIPNHLRKLFAYTFLFLLEDEIGDLKDEVELNRNESNEWKKKAQYYASENRIMTNHNKDLENTLESISKENKLNKAL